MSDIFKTADFTDEATDGEIIASYLGPQTKEEKIELLKLFDDVEVYEQACPSHRFRLINKHQVEFLAALSAGNKYKYIFQSCGNQGGKTAGLLYGMYLVAKGMLKGFPYKPTKDQGLFLILGGADHKVIKHSLVPELKKWAKPGEVIIKKGSSGNIDHIIVKNGDLADTTIVCLTYGAEAEGFISFKAHAAFLDEPCNEDILDEVGIRTLAYDGPICIAATRTISHAGPKFAWMKHLYRGTGAYKQYHIDKTAKIITASSYDNKVLKKEAIDKALGKFKIGSSKHSMRVKGIPDDPEGPIYPFEPFKYDEQGNEIPWHVGTLAEFGKEVDITNTGSYECSGALDYGYSAPFAVLNVVFSLRTKSVWVIGEGYETKLSPYEQMRLTKNVFTAWGMRPGVIVCDDQIENAVSTRDQTWHDSIKMQYEDALELIKKEDQKQNAVMPNWDTYLYTSREYKKDKAAGIQKLTNLMTLINPRTQKPYLRILGEMCPYLVEELSGLISKATTSAQGGENLTQGDDHAESAFRYLMTSIYAPDFDFVEESSDYGQLIAKTGVSQ